MSMFKEFKEFAVKGNAIDLAVGIVIGAAFNQIVNSLVKDILNPFLSLLTGRIDFSKLAFSIFGNPVNYGVFINTIINFLIVAFAVFLIVKEINRFRREPPKLPETKECPFCKTLISNKATRCPNCTSQL